MTDSEFGTTRLLYHGTSLDHLLAIVFDDCFETGNGMTDDGPLGISLTRSFDVAHHFSISKEEGFEDTLADYYEVERDRWAHPDPEITRPGVVVVFDRHRLVEQVGELIPHDWDSELVDEEEERTRGPIRPALRSVIAILHAPAMIEVYETLIPDMAESDEVEVDQIRERLDKLRATGLLRPFADRDLVVGEQLSADAPSP
jgi:hypothetical protein